MGLIRLIPPQHSDGVRLERVPVAEDWPSKQGLREVHFDSFEKGMLIDFRMLLYIARKFSAEPYGPEISR